MLLSNENIFQTGESIQAKPFPPDTSVRVLIAGLAYCKLNVKSSEINFLGHVPHHELYMMIFQKRRDSASGKSLLITRIEQGSKIFVTVDQAITPGDIATDGDYLLNELLNISGLHGKQIDYKPIINPKYAPIPLLLYKCAFYTEEMTKDRFEIIESDGITNRLYNTRKFGNMMGGKIKCPSNPEGNMNLDITGISELHQKFPLTDAEGEFVYEVYFFNHCLDIKKCEEELRGEGDFKFYYDLLEDADNPRRIFKLKKLVVSVDKEKESTDVAACNVVITEPPPN